MRISEQLRERVLQREEEFYGFIRMLHAFDWETVWQNATMTSFRTGALTRERAMRRGVGVLKSFFGKLEDDGLDFGSGYPGHGTGHIVRDYVHALRICSELDATPTDLFVGLVGGSLHDIGCFIVPRFMESERVLRHGEAGALLFDQFCDVPQSDLISDERAMIQQAIAAHTHYLKPFDVRTKSGAVHKVEPYRDTFFGDLPKLGVWLTRWVDRLDCCGPASVGRHFLTLRETHKDFDGKNFYTVQFEDHMRPLLRTDEEIRAAGGNRTMLEHLNMFVRSQTNESPYGRFDYGAMVRLRDVQKLRLMRIVGMVNTPSSQACFTIAEGARVINAWLSFLKHNVEPLAGEVADELTVAVWKLPVEVRKAWLNGFLVTMREYVDWANETMIFIDKLPHEWLNFTPIASDIRKVIAPHESWTSVIR